MISKHNLAKLAISLAAIIIIIVAFLVKQYPTTLENIYSKLADVFKPQGNESSSKSNPFFPPSGTGTTNGTNTTKPGQPTTPPSSEQQSGSSSTAITLEIIDICSGQMEDIFAVSEGVRHCLNQKYPYNILLEKNSTHLQTSFYYTVGFNETYQLNESNLIFYIFAEDVASVSQEIEFFSVEGDSNFYLGNYTLNTIWERNASGDLYISKMIVALPLYVKNTISEKDWTELKFYLNIPNQTYYLGNLLVLVKEK